MEILFKTLLTAHIAGGTMALLAGIVAMLAPKGKHYHALAGKTYYWSMALVCASAVIMCFLHPQQFLLYVAIFSFYLCFTGERMTKRKKLNDSIAVQDWVASILGCVAGIAMLIRGGIAISEQTSFGWVSILFGLLSLGFSVRDMVSFVKPSNNPMNWFFKHLTRMLGGYIATFTAFCVVNVQFLPQIAVWLLPTLLGSVGISVWTRYYRWRFQRV